MTTRLPSPVMPVEPDILSRCSSSSWAALIFPLLVAGTTVPGRNHLDFQQRPLATKRNHLNRRPGWFVRLLSGSEIPSVCGHHSIVIHGVPFGRVTNHV